MDSDTKSCVGTVYSLTMPSFGLHSEENKPAEEWLAFIARKGGQFSGVFAAGGEHPGA